MAFAAAASPTKSGENTLTGRMRQLWHAPVTPRPLFPVAAATPATAVPWLSSAFMGDGSLSLLLKSHPRTSST